MLILDQSITSFTTINVDSLYPDFVLATTYNFNDIVTYENYHYKSVTDGNLGNIPTDNPSLWLKWSVSNPHACIDLKSGTSTICDATTKTGGASPYDLILEFDTSRYDTIALGDVRGTDIIIEVFQSSDLVTPVQTITEKIETRYTVDSWFNYFYSPLIPDLTEFERNFFYRIQPVVGKVKVTVTEGYGSYSSIGFLNSGKTEYVADTLFSVGMGIEDYSKKETDEFGDTSLTRRISRDTMDIEIQFESGRINHVKRLIKRKLGKVVLFIVDESADSGYENLLLQGYVENYTTVLSNPVQTQASISISEVR